MYLVNVYKHGVLEHTELTTREVAVALCHLCRRLGNSGISAHMEAL